MYNLPIAIRYIQEAAQAVSAVSFFGYGLGCFVSEHMVAEFEHYRLAKLRTLTGGLQVAASIGIVAGHFYRPFLLLSAGGLAVMMLLAMITRYKIRDPLYLAIPATSLCLLNLFIVVAALRPLG